MTHIEKLIYGGLSYRYPKYGYNLVKYFIHAFHFKMGFHKKGANEIQRRKNNYLTFATLESIYNSMYLGENQIDIKCLSIFFQV